MRSNTFPAEAGNSTKQNLTQLNAIQFIPGKNNILAFS